MNNVEQTFVNASESCFHFLVKSHGFVRYIPQEELVINNNKTVSILYVRSGVYIKISLWLTNIALTMGKMEDGQFPESPTYWKLDTLKNSFSLDDLVNFQTQGRQRFETGSSNVTVANCEALLNIYAEALRTHGAQVLSGNLNMLEDIAEINRNRAINFLP